MAGNACLEINFEEIRFSNPRSKQHENEDSTYTYPAPTTTDRTPHPDVLFPFGFDRTGCDGGANGVL
jgi:hypothetical protein